MFGEYFIHFGILVLPLLAYQVWAFRKSFSRLPFATPIIGIYGGMCAVLSEIYPVHFFGLAADMKFIPLILSFLYGKRYAGLISLFISIAFRIHAGHHGLPLAIISMLLYSVPPYLVSVRFDSYSHVKKAVVSVSLSLLATFIQLGFLFVYFSAQGRGLEGLMPYLHLILPLAALQSLLMIPANLVLDHIVETGKIRLELFDYQKSLEESEQRYRSLVEYNPDGICAMNQHGSIVFVNPAYEQISGYHHASLMGSDRLNLWFENDLETARDIQARVMNGEVLSNIETYLRNKNGERVPVKITVVPTVVSGSIEGFYAIVTDLRPVKEAEEAIRKADKLSTVGELAAGVAHEIRNPLTSLKGFLKLLRSHDPTTSRYISVMEREMERLDFVSGQLLVLAKPQTDNRKLTDLVAIVRDVVEVIKTQAILSNVELMTSLGEECLYVLANENQIKQVLINVIKNGIEATPQMGTIFIGIQRRGTEVVVSVRDTGTGIPRDMLDRLGEPFYTTKANGTGLGLMISHRIIENHGGRIHYESHENVGTTVWIGLNRCDVPLNEALVESASEISS